MYKRQVQHCQNLKKYHPPPGNLELNDLGFFQNSKLRIIVEKVLPISLKLNFFPNTLGCYGLRTSLKMLVKWTSIFLLLGVVECVFLLQITMYLEIFVVGWIFIEFSEKAIGIKYEIDVKWVRQYCEWFPEPRWVEYASDTSDFSLSAGSYIWCLFQNFLEKKCLLFYIFLLKEWFSFQSLSVQPIPAAAPAPIVSIKIFLRACLKSGNLRNT